MGTDGIIRRGNGTSFASPILCGMVTCLWQSRPELTAKEVIELVQRSGDRSKFPDNIYGYGVPDMWNAYQTTRGINTRFLCWNLMRWSREAWSNAYPMNIGCRRS